MKNFLEKKILKPNIVLLVNGAEHGLSNDEAIEQAFLWIDNNQYSYQVVRKKNDLLVIRNNR